MPSKHGKGWRARWIDQHGERHSQTFRLKRDAESFEHRKKAEAEEIARGVRAELPPARSFGQLCDYWLENRASQKRSKIHDESIIRKHLRPAFGALSLVGLGVAEVDRFVVERALLSPKTIANLLTLLTSMLNVAKDLGWLRGVPRIRKPRVRACDKDFSYLRSDTEIERLLRSARAEDEMTHVLYATAVFTGLRKGELAALRWSDVDFERRLIAVQRSFDGPTKAGDVRHVPILDALLPTLRSWRLRCPGDLLFPNEANGMREPASRIFQETLHRVLTHAKFEKVERNGKKRPYITFHGLRHTFASQWVMKGGDLFKLQKILGHKTVQMTMRYAHLAPEAFSEDWGRFGEPMSEAATVIALPSRERAQQDGPATEPRRVAGDHAGKNG
jgi:integrase